MKAVLRRIHLISLILVVMLVLVFLTGCGRDGRLVHHFTPEKPPTQSFTATLKELDPDALRRVDILWVIDDSGSMQANQQAVKANTEAFMDEFIKVKYVDWRMGLISTTVERLPLLWSTPLGDFFNAQSSNPVWIFQKAVESLGLLGDAYEKPFLSIKTAFENGPEFIRSDAYLAVIIVTDAQEQSGISTDEFLQFLSGLKGGRKEAVRVYGAIAADDLGCVDFQVDSDWKFAGSAFERVIRETGGIAFSMCTSDFGVELSKIGKDLIAFLERPQIPLKSRPRPESIQIIYQGMEIPGGPEEDGGKWYYDYDLNAIIFYDLSFLPDAEQKITVRFEIDTGY